MVKVRNGFISNSSSSSFIINRYYLSDHQVDMIKNNDQKDQIGGDPMWEIDIDDYNVRGFTFMDNYDYGEFLTKIGVDLKFVRWE